MRGRFVLVRRVAAVLLVPLLCAAGILLYLNGRAVEHQATVVGDTAAPDRIELYVTAQQVSAAQRRVQLRVEVVPTGSFLEDSGVNAPAKQITLYSTSPTHSEVQFPAGRSATAQDLDMSLYGGTISDYPFDGYDTELAFAAVVDGVQVPVSMTFSDIDPFFRFSAVSSRTTNHVVYQVEHLTRAQGTKIMAVFMMIVMWALALSVLTGAWILVSRRRGLVWPALGWMAATLFALAALRNVAPGAPPIGCLLDYAAFFWAELLTAVGVVSTVLWGTLAERRREPLHEVEKQERK
ncbi:DUF4436 family protein [Actinospica durhamensis]|uniref:DUF4436 family protein n=1 Tax=Actinospica durhamensis TaxID=1508375 RepID=A0A941EJE2_9ACTN|nr:DUF4436 family protein [Actinospica durhamensis]MBR7833600.1 DUF4436 family protein [Actinospica durhamensis]